MPYLILRFFYLYPRKISLSFIFRSMNKSIYNPFDRFDFSGKRCFLSGAEMKEGDPLINVFPDWMMEQFELNEKPFKYLNEEYTTYDKLILPCSQEIYQQHILPLQ